jgi:hypothetical protein
MARIAPELTGPQMAALRRLALRREMFRPGVLAIEPSALQALVYDCVAHEYADADVLAHLVAAHSMGRA